MTLPLPIHHIGIAVSDMDAAITFYAKRFGTVAEGRETIEERGVTLCFLPLPNTRIELLAPWGENGVIKRFLDTHGPGIHHICYETPDIRAEMARLTAQGVQFIDLEPRPGAAGTIIAFAYPSTTGEVLVELLQRV